MPFETFREKERDGWGAKAEIYGDHTARITTQSIPALLGAVRTRVGTKLLDICCGPGFAAGAADAIGAEAEGVDFAPDMVRVAAETFPRCRFFEGDAQALPVPDASYDAAVCPFGVFHFTEPPRAFAEAARILRPGGRYAFSQWCAPAESPLFALVMGTIARHADMSRVDPAPDAFVYSDRERCRTAMAEAGFDDVEIADVPNVYHAPQGDFLDDFMKLSVRTPLILDLQTPETVAAIRDEVAARAREFATGDGFAVPVPSIVVSGVVPA